MSDESRGGETLTLSHPADRERRVGPEDWESHLPLPGMPQIVVGGPGTGKTQFLCERVASAIEAGHAAPDEVLMLAFSRRGASDIRARLLTLLGSDSHRVTVSTYHGLAMRIVEAHAGDLGWHSPPTVLAGVEQEHFVAGLLRDEVAETWHPAFAPILTSDQMAAEVTDFILRCHEHLLDASDITAHGRDQWRGLPEFFDRYLSVQVDTGRTDYGRILADAVRAVESWPDIAAPYRLVAADEYQDTSPAQARLLLGLAANTPELVVAADPYQSIYSFRGTDLNNVFEFPEATEAALGIRAERLVLTTSHRVPEEILSSAVSVTARELPGGAGKVLSTRTGGSVSAHVFSLETHEADWIAADIEHVHLKDGVPLERIAVFMRSASVFTGELTRALERRDIPHTFEESRLSDEPIIRFVRDLVVAATSDDNHDEAVRRVLQGPFIGVSAGAIAGMDARRALGESWSDIVAARVPNGEPLARLLSDAGWAEVERAPVGLWHIWLSLPQLADIATDRTRTDDVRAWSAFAQALDRLEERSPDATLLDHETMIGGSDFEAAPLFEFRTEDAQGVTVTTLHRSKGTSFDVVYIAQAVEGAIPDLRTTDSILGSRHLNPHLPTDTASYRAFRLDEERRLAYTAMTRASAKVVWTATMIEGTQGSVPSRFLTLVAPVTTASHDTAPLTPRSFEAALRRQLKDPLATDVERLAAVSILAEGSMHGLGHPLDRYGALERGTDDDIVPESLRMSPSQANTYDECPRKYAVDRYLMTQTEQTDYMRFGSLIHEVLENAEREAIDSGRERATSAEAIEWLTRVWEVSGFGEDAVGRAWQRRAVKMLNDMYRLWPSSARPVAFETPLHLTIAETPWYGIADRIEAIGEEVVIVDYKTGSQMTRADAAESLQLGYYAMAAAEDPDITQHGTVSAAEFWYPKITNAHAIGTRAFDMDSLDTVREKLIEITSAIQDEHFEPTPGPQCESCHLELVCPARAAGAEAFA
ncbi:MAG: ATP-dependent helicase [Actinomycetia bacterium]|nr:ATP-dependent helicase [Actinomycetes bacterium]